MREMGEDDACSKTFVREVGKTFAALAPFMDFLTRAAGHPFLLDD